MHSLAQGYGGTFFRQRGLRHARHCATMISRSPSIAMAGLLLATRSFVLSGMCLASFAGCALLASAPHTSGDHAFIVKWPAAGRGLRLAIKDNIDMAGVVTTAGSG